MHASKSDHLDALGYSLRSEILALTIYQKVCLESTIFVFILSSSNIVMRVASDSINVLPIPSSYTFGMIFSNGITINFIDLVETIA